MSSNPFAALDDSGDEAPKTAGKSIAIKKDTNKTADASKPVRKPQHNDRNTKHGRGGRAPPRDGKRQYDRRSGTGRGKEIKKDGGGARNWGSDKNEAKKMEGAINEEEVVEKNEEITEAADDAEPEPEPEPDNTMTLAEYMASKGQKEEKTGREVENEFKGLPAAVKKEEEDFLVMGGGKQKKSKKKNDEKKQSIELGFRPANPNSDRGVGGGRGRGGRGRGDRDGGRGGREGGRGGREGGRGLEGGRGGRGRGRDGGRGRGRDGRGRGRGGRGGNPQGLNVQDENAFPSL